MAEVKKMIWGAVNEGKLTEEEAEKKWKEYLKGRGSEKSKPDKKGHDLKSIWKELHAAVKAGKLTKEEAKAKMEALKKKEKEDD